MKKHSEYISKATNAQKFKISEEYSLTRNFGHSSLLDKFAY